MISPDFRPLNLVLVGSSPIEAGVLKFISVVVADERKHNLIVKESIPLAVTYFEQMPPIDGLFIYHDSYNDQPVSLQVAGRFREFYSDAPIGIISPPSIDSRFTQRLIRMFGERVFATSAGLNELEVAISRIERLVANLG